MCDGVGVGVIGVQPSTEAFPVRRVVGLEGVPGGLWRFLPHARKLPPPEPGTVRVLGVRGSFVAEDARSGFPRGLVMAAHSVSFVDIAARTLELVVELPAAPGHEPFKATLGFRCRVRDPAAVAGAHMTDLFPELEGYLAGLRWLRRFAERSTVDDHALVQRYAIDHISLHPPVIRDVRVDLAYLHIG
jgi:hypothetical protein